MSLKRHAGFTLIELMITLSIVIILAFIATPNWSNLIQDNSLSSAVNQVQGFYQLARSEALKRNKSVTLTSSDSRQNWALTHDVSGANETIKTHSISSDNIVIIPSGGNASEVSITVSSNGFAENETLAFNWGTEYRCLLIYSSGQSNTTSGNNVCTL